ncbi:hypothetical protein BDB00DRAFT_775367 [Zychaea mexicana]|uniref:uncharacterized protein n=1 Tax=Zychaea mexicana TaxID=64656 RepID=UPI0022FE4BAC|nr:uncharacterized protein BDB00DRAFT_775367 [Zychaea mexicana]KAI9482543.1 hypothetical protein BDB00DRAFT_775367 [Zychaea mexicana]
MQSAADHASNFLNSIGQELQGSSEAPYTDEGYYRDEGNFHRSEGYRSESRRRHSSRDRYRDRSREREGRRRRDRSRDNRRERSRDRRHRSRNRDDRDYRRSRNHSPGARRNRRSTSSTGRRDEPTVPLHKRERKLQNWDMAPPGMEGMTAEQVKQTGLFPLPGQVVGTRTPQSFAPPSEHALMADGSRARRLYVGQIPFEIDEKAMADFFNSTMQQLASTEGDAVVSVQINHDKNYAFVEFETPEQATQAMAFDGINFQTQTLKIRRPKDYQPPTDGNYQDNTPSTTSAVPDTPNKIFIGGLPIYLNEDQVVELLKSFGELRAFNLVKDPHTMQSKGFAFCEYADPSVTDLACQGLNNMELGDKRLVVQRASVGAKQGGSDGPSSGGNRDGGRDGGMPLSFVPSGVKDDEATRVLQLMNMVTPEELEDDEEFQDIWEDIAEECSKFGVVLDMKIPRPQSGQNVVGLGKIFVRFENQDQALSALRALAGRKFADRTVVSSFVDEDNYLADAF